MQLPTAFLAEMKKNLGDEFPDFKSALQGNPPTSIRYNPKKTTAQITENQVSWNSNGIYLEQRPIFTLDPKFHGGAYYVQEASSMFVGEATRQLFDLEQPLKVLDLCAAPGGKSTLLLSILKENSLMVSNEVIKSRYQILRENLVKWGNSNIYISNHDPDDFADLEGYFDLVLVDAPCSGEGLFRKDPKAMEEWSPTAVQHCAARQKRILSVAQSLVKEDGILMYCTCTYNKIENANNVKWLLENHNLQSERLEIPTAWKIIEQQNGASFSYQFFPHRTKGEGFFISCFRQKEATFTRRKHKYNGFFHLQKLNDNQQKIVQPFLNPSAAIQLFQIENGRIFAFPKELVPDFSFLNKALKKSAFGVEIGIIKGNGLVPAHALATSQLYNEALPTLSLSREQALHFLKKLPFDFSAQQQGWHLIKHEEIALGWAKVLKNRMNNYYPKEWRIRMEI